MTHNTLTTILRRFAFFLLFSLFFIVRTTAGSRSTLVVNLRDGNSASFNLCERPRITLADERIKIVSAMNEVEFALSDVRNYVFSENTTSVDDVLVGAPEVMIDDNGLTLSGLKSAVNILVYTVDGKFVASGRTDEEGCCTLVFNGSQRGVYLINFDGVIIKYYKK